MVNDIITINRSNKMFTHRVIYKGNDYLITKGDKNLITDGKIRSNQIVGKVYQLKRRNKLTAIENIYLIQSTFYFKEISKIIDAFQKNHIDYLILKGLPLHLFFDKHLPRRIYSDCDIMIKKRDFLIADKILEKFGYKKDDVNRQKIENNYLKKMNDFPVVFDIHLEPTFLMTKFGGLEALYSQKLINKFTDELFNNRKQITINNSKYWVLDNNYSILYLALHIFHHNFRGAFRYQFLDTVIIKSRLKSQDWVKIKSIIDAYKFGHYLSPVFILLRRYYKTPVPKLIYEKKYKPLRFNIFDDETPIQAGINRFSNIFFLSYQPLWKKIFIIFNPQVIYFSFLVARKKLFSFFSN
ncbi:nucleotidyltransferase family protein [Patescibacteria group bacterium]|nr:nucleotidyltransferase family protein [Patescibacteria group bacterium]